MTVTGTKQAGPEDASSIERREGWHFYEFEIDPGKAMTIGPWADPWYMCGDGGAIFWGLPDGGVKIAEPHHAMCGIWDALNDGEYGSPVYENEKGRLVMLDRNGKRVSL